MRFAYSSMPSLKYLSFTLPTATTFTFSTCSPRQRDDPGNDAQHQPDRGEIKEIFAVQRLRGRETHGRGILALIEKRQVGESRREEHKPRRQRRRVVDLRLRLKYEMHNIATLLTACMITEGKTEPDRRATSANTQPVKNGYTVCAGFW